MPTLSVAIATFNEEENIGKCLESVSGIAEEIVVVDGTSKDATVEIAKKIGARVIVTSNPEMFHINKQKAIDAASGDWILQMDADERLTVGLKDEVKEVIGMDEAQIKEYQNKLPKRNLFKRHQDILDKRDGKVGDDALDYSAFFIPRANFFLGRYLMHGGVYPDGVIRLFRKGKAYLPCRDVHEQFVVKGRVGWLKNDLLHFDSPTFKKYIKRNNRYTSLLAGQFKSEKLGKNPVTAINYIFIKPVAWFFLTYIRHKGFLDSWQGFVFSFFSSLRFAVGYIKYLKK